MTAANGPDLDELTALLDAVQGRDPGSTSRERLDSDHQVLLSVQAELAEAVQRSAERGEDAGRTTESADEQRLQDLLDRVVNEIERNRTLRG